MAPSYPVMLRLDGVAVLLVGGGPIAARKLEGLLAAGAVVTVVAPSLVAEIAASPARLERRGYRAGEAAGYRLVMTATGVADVDRQVADDATTNGVWVNSADDPANCSFTLPAVERRGAVTLAVSTDGRSPALAGWLRDELAAALPAGVDRAAEDLARQRAGIRAAGESTETIDWSGRIRAALDAAALVTAEPAGGEPQEGGTARSLTQLPWKPKGTR